MNSIERKVLELIGEDPDSPDVFVDTADGMAPIRDSINDAIQEITIVTGGYKTIYPLPLRAGQAFYRFAPSDGYFGWVTDCWDVTRKVRLEQTDLIRLTRYDPRWMVGSGYPEAYLQLGTDVIGFYKKPSASSNIIEITMVEIPKAYTSDTDRVKLRDTFTFACVHYAVGEYWASRGDAVEAKKYLGLYLDAVGLREKFSSSLDYVPRFATNKEPWPKATA